jgi:hypothetical protein
MKISQFSLLALIVTCCLALTACIGGSSTGARVRLPDTPDGMIQAAMDHGSGHGTRLHPDYIWNTLDARAEDPAISAAFDKALADRSEDSMQALLRVLELKFIHDPKMSSLDLLGPELSEHFRQFEWQPADYPGGAEGPNEKLADIMCDALDNARPERRANRSRDAVIIKKEATEEIWKYMEAEWVPVPGQEERKLNRHALDPFVRMREQAKAEGVDLIISSSHRMRETAERNAARANNPNAVASFSAHSLGLAIDFKLSQQGAEYPEIGTSPMSDVIRMRESPVHKWLHLRGEEFGWYPYQNEPWHWEYNPPGFRDVYFSTFPGGAPKRTSEQLRNEMN